MATNVNLCLLLLLCENYSQNARNAISKTQKFYKSRGGNRMPPDPQRNAQLQAKINFPISGGMC
jgi:hypothetical protein